MMFINRFPIYARLMRLDKPIGIVLLLWPTLWALWIASQGVPSFKLLFIFILGVIVMRSAGCVINDFADRHVDGFVARTKSRPLAQKAVSSKEALGVFFVLIVCAFLLVLFTNRYTIALSFGGVLIASIYPFLKRFTHLPQLVLGVAFSWGVLMAFTAVTNALPGVAWELFFAAALWPVAYDTLYAMADREDDLKIGVKSTAILFGQYDRLIVGLIQISMLVLLYDLARVLHFSLSFYVALFVSGLFFVYQHILIRSRDAKGCFTAFLNNHWVGLIIFVGIVLNYSG